MANFADVLDQPLSEAKAPVPLPTGEYIFLISGPFALKEGKSKAGEDFSVAEFPARPIQAMESVDQEALATYGWPTEKTQRYSVFLTGENSAYFFKQQAENVFGIDASNMTLRQALSQLQGRQFRASVTHKPSDDGTGLFAQINPKTVAKV